jgi:hypothetical protein
MHREMCTHAEAASDAPAKALSPGEKWRAVGLAKPAEDDRQRRVPTRRDTPYQRALERLGTSQLADCLPRRSSVEARAKSNGVDRSEPFNRKKRT